MTQLMTVQQLKEALPKNLHSNATQELADTLNQLACAPEEADLVRENFITFSKVLSEGKFKTEDYLNAVRYCTYKIMGYTHRDAYAKTFPDRWNLLALKGAPDKDISAYVSGYHKGQLVTKILQQAMIPGWLLHQDAFHRAVKTQYDLMIDENVSPKVRVEAANSLMTHLKPPEAAKVQVDVSVKQSGGIADLAAAMANLAQTQLEQIQAGGSAREIGRVRVVGAEEPVEAEFTEIQAEQGPMPGPTPLPAPVQVETVPDASDPRLMMPTSVDSARALEQQLVNMSMGGKADTTPFKSLFSAPAAPVDKPVEQPPQAPAPSAPEPVDDEPEDAPVPGRKPSLFDRGGWA